MTGLPQFVSADDEVALPDFTSTETEDGEVKKFGKQMLAGLLRVGTVPNALYGLASAGTEYLGAPLPGGKRSTEIAQGMRSDINEFVGTTEPQNTREALADVIGSIAVPIPGSTISAVARAIPGLTKLITAAPKTTSVLGNLAEVFTPTVVKPSAGRYAANLGVGLGVQEGMNAYSNDPNYTSQLPDFGQDRVVTDLPAFGSDDAIVPLPKFEDSGDDWSNLKVFSGTALAMAGAWYAMRRKPGSMLRAETIAAPDLEAAPFKTATTAPESIITQTQNANYGLVSQLGKATDEATAKEFEQALDLNTRAGGAAQTESVLKSGIYPGGKVRGPSTLSTQLEFQQRDPAFQKLVSDGMVAQDLIESRALIRASTKDPTRVTNLPGLDDATAKAQAQALQANPEAVAMANTVRQTMRNTLEFAKDEGFISPTLFGKLIKQRPNYVPMRPAGESMTDAQFNSMLKRTDEAGKGVSEVLNPIQSAESYNAELMRRVMNNTQRRYWIDNAIMGKDVALKNSFREVKNAAPDTHTIYRNGEAKHYEFADPLTKQALDFSPIMTNGIMGAATKLYQSQTTGWGSPLKSVRSLEWDTIAAANYREPGRVYGLLDQIVQAASGGKLAYRGDIVGGQVSTAMGFARTAGARIAGELADAIEADLKTSSGMWSKLPPTVAKAVAVRMRDAELNSVWHAFESSGGKSSALLHDDLLQASTKLRSLTDHLKTTQFGQALGEVGLQKLWRYYMATLDTMQSAVKVQYMAENAGRAPTAQLAHEARSIGGGDFAIKGLGRVVGAKSTLEGADSLIGGLGYASQKARDWIPYANPTLQGLTKLGSVWQRDGMKFIGGLAGSVGSVAAASAILNSSISPEWTESYWNAPAWWRMSNVPLPVGDTWGEFVTVPIPPEFSLMVAGTQNAIAQLFGLDNGMSAGMGPDMLQALSDTVGLSAPVAVNALMAAGGAKLSLTQGIQSLPESRVVPGYTHGGSVMMTNVQEVLSSILSTSAKRTIEMANAFATSPGDAGAVSAMEQGWEDTKRAVPGFGSLWAGAVDSATNDVSLGLSKKMDALDRIETQLRNMNARGATSPVDAGNNPTFTAQSMQAIQHLRTNPAVLELKQNIKSISNNIETLNRIYPKREGTMQEIGGLKRELRNMREKLGRQITTMEQSLGTALEDIIP